jgi:hypothetical protein
MGQFIFRTFKKNVLPPKNLRMAAEGILRTDT